MSTIAIIGTGALGIRHFQALARLDGPIRVDLVDPVAVARERALGLLTEVGGINGEVRQFGGVDELQTPPDVAIVATNARERLAAVLGLCGIGCPAMILEKVLFTRREEYVLAGDAIRKVGVSAWVNCARRTAPRFHRLRDLIAGRPISYRVEGANWGLASNVIHHLDEWMFLSGEQSVILRGGLDPGLIPAPRNRYFEVSGTISGQAGAHSFVAVGRVEAGVDRNRVVSIRCDKTELVIGQASQDLLIRFGGRLIAREVYPTALQSEATAWHIATIFAGGEPSLPRYEESRRHHLALLDVLLPHFQSIDSSLTECPIT